MASVMKDPRTGNYIAKFVDEDGVRIRRSTKLKHKPAALRLAHEWEQEALAVRKRRASGRDPTLTVGVVVTAYLEKHLEAKERVSAKNVRRLAEKYILPALGGVTLEALTAPHVERLLDELETRPGRKLGPQSINHIRGTLLRAIRRAKRIGLWGGPNVVEDVETRTLSQPSRTHVPLEDAGRLFAAIPPQHLVLCLTAVLVGMRKGELLALRKVDVKQEHGGLAITVQRSNWRDRTKSGRTRHVPVPDVLAPALLSQMEQRPDSPMVFPDEDGKQRKPHFDAAVIIKRALAKAGIVEGYDHKCRRRSCRHVERFADREKRQCPKCGRRMWPVPVPRKDITFHSLRHSAATWMRQAGVSPFAAMHMLGHSNEQTLNRYSHALVPELRAATAPFVERVVAKLPALSAASGHRLVTEPNETSSPVIEDEKKPPISRGLENLELDGIEPTTSSLQSSRSPN